MFLQIEKLRRRNAVWDRGWLASYGCISAFALIASTIIATPSEVVAQSPHRTDSAALNVIFEEETLDQNAVQFCEVARRLSAEQQYAVLARWTVPGDGHGIRVSGTIYRPAENAHDVADSNVTDLVAYPESQWIYCPAKDLVAVAVKLMRLQELNQVVLEFRPSDTDQLRNQTTLLTLIEIAGGKKEVVAQRLAERFTVPRNWQDAEAGKQWWSDLIVLWAASENPDTADLVIEDLFGAISYREYIPDSQLDLIGDYLALLYGHCVRRSLDKEKLEEGLIRDQFDVFSRVDAKTHGRVRPLTRYYLHKQSATKLSGHEMDYLAFRTPLSGDMEVACEIATRTGSFNELMIDGIAAKPTPNLQQVAIASFAKDERQAEISPAIHPVGTHTWVGGTSTEQGSTYSWNGRDIHQDSAVNRAVPWIAIRSWRRTFSQISNLALAGTPSVPTEVNLLTEPSLRGWGSYYGSDSNQGLGSWYAVLGAEAKLELKSEISGDKSNCFDEDLLCYIRPIDWDAKITYEFEHREKISVHPCFGRSVFLLRPDGVWLHHLTDGRYDTTHLRPDNATRLTDNSGEPLAAPLLVEGWNQAELSIQGNRITLHINGDRVAVHEIQVGSARTFGLFHYRDQSTAVVRNICLYGDWTQQIPSPSELSLGSKDVVRLDEAAAKLPVELKHDFKEGASSEWFSVEGDPSNMTQQADGLRLQRTAEGRNVVLHLRNLLDGDFDAILAFKDLEIGDEKPTWHSGIGMAVNLHNKERDRFDVVRRRDRVNRHQHIAFAHNTVNLFGGVIWVSDTTHVDESLAGRLRLVRYQSKIYGLYATGNSEIYRLIDSIDLPPGPVDGQNLRLYLIAGSGMHVNATVTNLVVRAEKVNASLLMQPQAIPFNTQPQVLTPPPQKSLPARIIESFRDVFN